MDELRKDQLTKRLGFLRGAVKNFNRVIEDAEKKRKKKLEMISEIEVDLAQDNESS